jgi:ubiquinone/menaquinone biosynthesis C-methylase UbiE
MAREDEIAALGASADAPGPSRADKRQAKITSRTLDIALGALPLPLRVLDVGCGYGDLLKELSERVPNIIEIVGIDPDPEKLDEAHDYAGEAARLFQAGAESLPFQDGHFDLIVALNSFNYWRNPERGMAEIARVLHPAGVFVLADSSARGVPSALSSARLRLIRRESVERSLGRTKIRAFIASR